MVGMGRDLGFIVGVFQPQRFEGDCLPACIKGSYDEYREREGIGSRLGYKQIRKGIGCHPQFGTPTDGSEIQAALNPEIKAEGFAFKYQYGRDVGIENLEALLQDERTSFPVVSVSPGWWQDKDVPEQGRNQASDWEHCVILLDMGERTAQVHDPLVRQLNSRNPERFIFEVPLIRFEDYWGSTEYPQWTLWIQPTTDAYQAKILGEWD